MNPDDEPEDEAPEQEETEEKCGEAADVLRARTESLGGD